MNRIEGAGTGIGLESRLPTIPINQHQSPLQMLQAYNPPLAGMIEVGKQGSDFEETYLPMGKNKGMIVRAYSPRGAIRPELRLNIRFAWAIPCLTVLRSSQSF